MHRDGDLWLAHRLKAATTIDDDQQADGASSGPVWVRTRSERVLKILLAPDREPDHRSGSSSALNLGPNHGQVQLGSGSNHGSELNLTIPINGQAVVGPLEGAGALALVVMDIT